MPAFISEERVEKGGGKEEKERKKKKSSRMVSLPLDLTAGSS